MRRGVCRGTKHGASAGTPPARRGLCLIAAAIMLFAAPSRAAAYTVYEKTFVPIAAVRTTLRLRFSHSGEGFWEAECEGQSLKIRDIGMELALISGTAEPDSSAKWQLELPEKVKSALREGRVIKAEASCPTGLLHDLLAILTVSDSALLYARPVLTVSRRCTLSSFVSGMRTTVPLIDSSYGRNLYKLFGIGSLGRTAEGLFLDSSPLSAFPPYMHPVMIANSAGGLRAGYRVNAEGRILPSALLSAGFFSLKDGGAVELEFDYPVIIRFYEEITAEKECGAAADAE